MHFTGLERRLTRVEAKVDQFLESNQLSDERMARRLDELYHKVDNSQRPQYAILLSLVTLLALILGGFTQLVTAHIDQVSRLRQDANVARVAALEQRIVTLAEQMHREVIMLDQNDEASLKELNDDVDELRQWLIQGQSEK